MLSSQPCVALACRLGIEAYQNQPPGPGRYAVAAAWCPAGAPAPEAAAGEGWREAAVAIDEAGLTAGGGGELAGWRERESEAPGVLLLDFLSNKQP